MIARALRWCGVWLGFVKPRMLVRCAWCSPKKIIGEKRCDRVDDGRFTDGICPQCRETYFGQFGPRFEAAETVKKPVFHAISGADWEDSIRASRVHRAGTGARLSAAIGAALNRRGES